METMFGRKEGPTKPFTHSDDCAILKADPNVEIPWSEIRRGVWEARCVCGVQYHHDPITDDRVRNDPLKIGHRGAPRCELHGETDPAVLRLALKAVERDGYWWVQRGACDIGWQFHTTPRASDDVEPGAAPAVRLPVRSGQRRLTARRPAPRGGTPALRVELREQFERIGLAILGQVNVRHTADVRKVARPARDRHVEVRALSPEVHHARADDLASTGDVECAGADRPPACAERALSPLGTEIDSSLALDVDRGGERVADAGTTLADIDGLVLDRRADGRDRLRRRDVRTRVGGYGAADQAE